MKDTGIVRRIDELGRIVIPKEMRKVLKLKVGEEMQIYTEDDALVLKRFSELGREGGDLKSICAAVVKAGGVSAAVCDTKSFIAAEGAALRRTDGEDIAHELYAVLEERRSRFDENGHVRLTENGGESGGDKYIVPVIVSGDLYGGVIIASDKLSPNEYVLADLICEYLGARIE